MMLEGLRFDGRGRYRIGRYRLMAALLRHAPLRKAYRFARWHERRDYNGQRPILQGRPDDTCGRLGATAAQVDAWLTRHYELTPSEPLDRTPYRPMSADEIHRLIEVRGVGHLEGALARGKGAILCSGHVMGHVTFPYGNRRVASHQNAFTEERLGIRFHQDGQADFGVRTALNALRGNGVVSFEIDQRWASAG